MRRDAATRPQWPPRAAGTPRQQPTRSGPDRGRGPGQKSEVAEPSRRIRNGLPATGLEVCGGHPDLPFTVRTRDGFPDFDGGHLLVFVEHVFEFGAEPALRYGGLRAGCAEAAHGPFEVIFHVRVPTPFVQKFQAPAFSPRVAMKLWRVGRVTPVIFAMAHLSSADSWPRALTVSAPRAGA